ncbi:MAG: cytochrome c biosis protein CcsA [Verrucomicrobiota bacterium]|jgi:ABC-type uncharacterized transport system permease subunit
MRMDRWLLLTATLLAFSASVGGMISVHCGRRSQSTVIWMTAVMLCQLAMLAIRGNQHGVCPLVDWGERLVFLSWALTLFYLLVGQAYRISLLGVFTAPVVVTFQSIALLPGVLSAHAQPIAGGNLWHEMHSATSVLSYGALALASVAGVMFLVLNRQLKGQHLKSGLFRNLPPVRELLTSLERLLWLGIGLLSLGLIAGLLMPHDGKATAHRIAALIVWTCYATLLAVHASRGLTGRRISLLSVSLFILSLGVFALI